MSEIIQGLDFWFIGALFLVILLLLAACWVGRLEHNLDRARVRRLWDEERLRVPARKRDRDSDPSFYRHGL